MIESRIGITRFTDILKRPFSHFSSRPSWDSGSSGAEWFYCASFKQFYEVQVESIKHSLYEFYAGSGENLVAEKSPEQQIIQMQKQTITELELKIASISAGAGVGGVETDLLLVSPVAVSAQALERDAEHQASILQIADLEASLAAAADELKVATDKLNRVTRDCELSEAKRRGLQVKLY